VKKYENQIKSIKQQFTILKNKIKKMMRKKKLLKELMIKHFFFKV
jgi:hypothetical protein